MLARLRRDGHPPNVVERIEIPGRFDTESVFGRLDRPGIHHLVLRGKRPGDAEAAQKAFAEFGEVAGDAMATAVTLIDGLIVIGGGITAARKWIMPSLLRELRSKIHQFDGNELNRVQMKVYDLDDEAEFLEFARGDNRTLKVYGTDRYVAYDPQKRIGVTISKLGASRAISVGAYAYALSKLYAQNNA